MSSINTIACMNDIKCYFHNRHSEYPIDSICHYDMSNNVILLYYSTFIYYAKHKDKLDFQKAMGMHRLRHHHYILDHIKPILLKHLIDKIAITYHDQNTMKAWGQIYSFDNSHFFIKDRFELEVW